MPLTVVLDTETTGLGHVVGRADGVVQVALAYRDPATREVAVWSEACDPGASFYQNGRAAEAFRINGMTEERLARARPAAAVAADLRARLAALEAAHGPLDLRAYNVDFDRPLLAAPPWALAGPWGPCLLKAARASLDPHGGFKLGAVCARLGIAFPGDAHHADTDAHAALLVHEAMQARRVPVYSAAATASGATAGLDLRRS